MKCEIVGVELARDYGHLKAWWDERGFPAPNPAFLPPVGGIVLVDDVPVCAGFLFQSDANTAIIGNIVSNPRASGPLRNAGLDFLLTEMGLAARNLGFGMICCSTNLEALGERFARHGFVQTDEGVRNFGRVL